MTREFKQVLQHSLQIASDAEDCTDAFIRLSVQNTTKIKLLDAPQFNSIRRVAERVTNPNTIQRTRRNAIRFQPANRLRGVPRKMPKQSIKDAKEEVISWGKEGVTIPIADTMAFRLLTLEALAEEDKMNRPPQTDDDTD